MKGIQFTSVFLTMGTLLMPGQAAISRILTAFRRNPVTPDTAHGRSRERYRRAALWGSTSFIAKALSMGVSLITVRLAFRYLGAERYGMWMTITSIVLMFGSADLGMSGGLVNHIADAAGRGDKDDERRASSSAFWMLSGVTSILAIGMLAAYPFLNTARMFNVHSPTAIHESGPAFLAFFYCFVLNLPLGTARGVQVGLQKGYVNSLWLILGIILSLVALLIAIHLRVSLAILVLSLSGPPLIASILNATELFGWSHRELMPRLKNFSRAAASRLLHTGLMYFLLQLSLTIGMQTDNVVIAQILGAKSVADYAVPARLFNILIALSSMVTGTFWPAYTEAFARSEGAWVRRAFLRVTTVLLGANLLGATVLILFGNRILAFWIGREFQTSTGLFAALGAMSVISSFVGSTSVLLNGLSKFRAQVIFGLLMAGLNLPLSIFFVRRYGIVGAALGTIIAQTLVQVIPMTILVRDSLRDISRVPAT